MMQKTLKKSKKENPEKIKSYIVTENGLGKFLMFTDENFALHSLKSTYMGWCKNGIPFNFQYNFGALKECL